MNGLYFTDGSNVYSNNLDLDLTSVDSNIPNVVPPADGSSTSGIDFLGSLSQMGDNLLRSPPHSSTQPGSTASERPSTAPESTTSTDCPPGDQDDEALPRRPSAPPSPQPAEPPSSTEDTEVQPTPPIGVGGGNPGAAAREAADAGAMSAGKTSTQTTTTTTTTTSDSGNNADVDSIEFACNLTFDTTDLIDAGARHEVIDVRD